jgi:hypothetical protein
MGRGAEHLELKGYHLSGSDRAFCGLVYEPSLRMLLLAVMASCVLVNTDSSLLDYHLDQAHHTAAASSSSKVSTAMIRVICALVNSETQASTPTESSTDAQTLTHNLQRCCKQVSTL